MGNRKGVGLLILMALMGCQHRYSWDRGYPNAKTSSNSVEEEVQRFEILKLGRDQAEFRPSNSSPNKTQYSRISIDPMLKRISPQAFELIQQADLEEKNTRVMNSLYFQASTFIISPGMPPWVNKARDVAVYGTLAYIIYRGSKIQNL